METPPQRRQSFGMLLRRSKSTELSRKAQALREAELERQRHAVPPRLPEFANNSEQLSKSVGSQLKLDVSSPPQPPMPTSRTDSLSHSRNYTNSSAVPSIPFDPYARTESMTHRGRYSYASSAISTLNSPRRVRRRKDPTPFNVLVIGPRSSGKTSFLEFLKTALALPPKKRSKKSIEDDEFYVPTPASGNFIPHFMETEIDNERIGLTLWDSEGLDKNVVDLQLREMSAFIESKFEETFAEEMKVVRSPGAQDTHIHAVFLVLDPAHLDRNIKNAQKASLNGFSRNGAHSSQSRINGALDEDVELQVLRILHKKTTVIPVIGKADTITSKHMRVLKKAVWESIKGAGLDPLEALGLEDDTGSDRIDEEDEEYEEDDYMNENIARDSIDEAGSDNMFQPQKTTPPTPMSPSSSKRLSSQSIMRHKAAQEDSKEEETPFLPLSIISPDLYEPDVIGRQFPWGFADPYNEQHCDFERLKEAVFTEWRAELREASKEQWYEGWRTSKLKHRNLPYRRR